MGVAEVDGGGCRCADNRLVASELERRWEAALNEVRQAEEALADISAPKPLAQRMIGKPLGDKIVALAGRLPQIWADPATTDVQRKALLRCLVEKVVLDRGERDVARVRIVWRGGTTSDLSVRMRVNAVPKLTRGEEMPHRALNLARSGTPDDEIAAILSSEGHRSPNCADKVLPITVQRLRLGAGIKVSAQRTRWEHDRTLLSTTEVTARLSIPVNWLYVQIRKERLLIDRQPNGAYLFQDTPFVLDAVRKLRNHVVDRIDLRICQPHQEGHQHA